MISTYLSGIKKTFLECKAIKDQFVYVCGNEATDLDSTISTLCFSYVFQTWNAKTLVPFINCSNPKIIEMRGEIQLALKTLEISREDFLFQQDVLSRINGLEKVDFCLLDHNKITQRWSKIFPNLPLINVSAIIDHHVDEGDHLKAHPRVIDVTGSNVSLLLRYIKENCSTDHWTRAMKMREVLRLTVTFDTVNLTWRARELDVDALRWLVENDQLDQSSLQKLNDKVVETLESCEIREENFEIQDLLTKDYKFYEAISTAYGIATLHVSIEHMTDNLKSIDGFSEKIYSFMQAEKILILLLTIGVRSKDHACGHFQQLAIFAPDRIIYAGIRQAMNACQLSPIFEADRFGFFNQYNLEISRKQLQPIMQNFLTKVNKE